MKASSQFYLVDGNGCWLWQRSLYPSGYGQASAGGAGNHALAHRLYYERHRGPIPDGLVIDHLCGVRHCVNPDHLEPVSIAENCRRGQNAKLSHRQAEEIKLAVALGSERQVDIGARFGVSQQTVSQIKRRTRWA